MGFSGRLAALTFLLGWAGLCVPASAWATLYQCTDSSGAEVFTDSPAQLQQCMPVTTDTTEATASPPLRSLAKPEQGQETASPPSAQTSDHAGGPPRPSQTAPPAPQVSGPHSAGPERGPEPPPPPSASQPCMPSLNNPLDPLHPVPCPPSQK